MVENMGVFLAKTVADLTFGGAFLFYLVKALIYMAVGFGAICLGIRLRKNKNAKTAKNASAE